MRNFLKLSFSNHKSKWLGVNCGPAATGWAIWGLPLLLVAAPAVHAETKEAKPFEPKFASLEKHEVPTWFEDAKPGIFVHWGIYSVPAFAPPSEQLGKHPETEFFKKNPYAEWYYNSMRIDGSTTQEHHLKTYGANFDYYRFGETFNQDVKRWNRAETVAIFKSVHAQYVVLTCDCRTSRRGSRASGRCLG